MDQSLLTKLRRERSYQPAKPQDLLVLSCSLYLMGRPRTFTNYMHLGIPLFQEWCLYHPAWAEPKELDELSKYSGAIYDACLCGDWHHAPNRNGSLRSHCSSCRGNIRSHIITAYEIQRISVLVDLPMHVVERAMIYAIVRTYYERTRSGRTTGT